MRYMKDGVSCTCLCRTYLSLYVVAVVIIVVADDACARAIVASFAFSRATHHHLLVKKVSGAPQFGLVFGSRVMSLDENDVVEREQRCTKTVV